MSYNTVFIVEPVIRTGVISSLQEAVHFVLIEIDHAHVAVVVIIVDKIGAGLAVSYFFLFHKCTSQMSSMESVAIAFRLSSAVMPARKL